MIYDAKRSERADKSTPPYNWRDIKALGMKHFRLTAKKTDIEQLGHNICKYADRSNPWSSWSWDVYLWNIAYELRSASSAIVSNRFPQSTIALTWAVLCCNAVTDVTL